MEILEDAKAMDLQSVLQRSPMPQLPPGGFMPEPNGGPGGPPGGPPGPGPAEFGRKKNPFVSDTAAAEPAVTPSAWPQSDPASAPVANAGWPGAAGEPPAAPQWPSAPSNPFRKEVKEEKSEAAEMQVTPQDMILGSAEGFFFQAFPLVNPLCGEPGHVHFFGARKCKDGRCEVCSRFRRECQRHDDWSTLRATIWHHATACPGWGEDGTSSWGATATCCSRRTNGPPGGTQTPALCARCQSRHLAQTSWRPGKIYRYGPQSTIEIGKHLQNHQTIGANQF